MQRQTTIAKANEIVRKWYVVDATNKPLGRLASEIAVYLCGKNKPIYTPNVDCGDYIIVINAEKVSLSGDKENKKNYLLMNISSVALIISMIFSVVLILLGIFSTIKLSLFIALIIIDLLILVAGVLAEYMSEKRFNKDYKNYKAEHTVVARKIEVEPRRKEVKGEETEEVNKTPKKRTTTKKATSKSTTPKKKTTTKKTTKKA